MQPTTIGMPTPLSGRAIADEGVPRGWTNPVTAAAWQHALEAYPKESLGLVLPDGYEPLANTAVDPTQGALADLADLVRVEPGALVVHSHPNGPQCPSAADMRCQAAWGVPFVVLPVGKGGPLGRAFAWGFGETMPYEGRPFRHGIWDCFRLVRDWFAAERGLEIPDMPRDWEWWTSTPDLDLYRAGYAAQGFKPIPLAEAVAPGDVIFYAIRCRVPQHAAIVLDAQTILHHPAGALEFDPTRRSTRDLRSRWHPFAVEAVRRA